MARKKTSLASRFGNAAFDILVVGTLGLGVGVIAYRLENRKKK